MCADNNRLTVTAVRAAAAGRWRYVLERVGLPAGALTRRNKPCPVCGGTDRFSFIDDGRGAFVCRGLERCGGDGFALVQHFLGCDFPAALAAVASALGMENAGNGFTAPEPPPRTHEETPRPVVKDNGGIYAIWRKGKPLTACCPAGLYLSRRGLALPDSDALRFTYILDYWHDRQIRARCPAMLAKVTSPGGDFVGLHRTWLNHAGDKARITDSNGEPLPVKKLATVRPHVMKGAAVRLFPPSGGRLALTEGIETALAVNQASGLPVWACVSAFGLEHITPPDDVTDVWIFGDNDASKTGQRSAERLARRLKHLNRAVRVFIPECVGEDWLDVFNRCQGDLNGV